MEHDYEISNKNLLVRGVFWKLEAEIFEYSIWICVIMEFGKLSFLLTKCWNSAFRKLNFIFNIRNIRLQFYNILKHP